MRDQGSKGWSHEAKSVNPFESDYTKLNQEKTENLNKPITSMEIETVIRNLPGNKSPGPNGFTAEFHQKFREELTPIIFLGYLGKELSLLYCYPYLYTKLVGLCF